MEEWYYHQDVSEHSLWLHGEKCVKRPRWGSGDWSGGWSGESGQSSPPVRQGWRTGKGRWCEKRMCCS